MTRSNVACASPIPGASIDLRHAARDLAQLRLLIYIENKARR
jgi:hypothetical protein